MQRVSCAPRPDWEEQAHALGFDFHRLPDSSSESTVSTDEADDLYWDETAYYCFTLQQIEQDLEDPTAELESLCLDLVEQVVRDEALLTRLGIPASFHDLVAQSWQAGDRNLYGRFDLAYDGTGPAKLYEYNADTPTALFESAVFQWDWLEQARRQNIIPLQADQFNSIHEKLLEALPQLQLNPGALHFTCWEDHIEDRGTVRYLDDCAQQAGFETHFVHIEEIGLDKQERFLDGQDRPIDNLFKLYPWEWLFADPFGVHIATSNCCFIEPPWKAVLSNKAILPLLWQKEPGHPNLLPAYFEDDPDAGLLGEEWVRKPFFSREGANITVMKQGHTPETVDGPYDDSGFILQAYHPLPIFVGNHTVIGSWVVASQPCGIGIREDISSITRDSSRFLPHIILD